MINPELILIGNDRQTSYLGRTLLNQSFLDFVPSRCHHPIAGFFHDTGFHGFFEEKSSLILDHKSLFFGSLNLFWLKRF